MFSSLVLGIALGAFVMAALALGFAAYCLIEIKAMQRATHSVQFVPADQFASTPPSAPLSDDDGAPDREALRAGLIHPRDEFDEDLLNPAKNDDEDDGLDGNV